MRNGSGTKTRVAIAGLGAIGMEVAKALDHGIDGLELAAVSAANIDKHRPWLDKLGKVPAALPIEALADAPLILYDAQYGAHDPMRRQLVDRAQRAGVTLRPVIAVSSGRSGRSKNRGALRQAWECAAPMNA